MGIQNDAILCYGIEFSYDDIVYLKDTIKFKQLAEDIDTDNMVNLWSEMGHITCSNYFDQEEEYYTYIIGKELKSDMTLNELIDTIDQYEIKNNLRDICEEYNLVYSTPRILCRPNVY